MVSVFRRFFCFLELFHGQFCSPRLLITHIKAEAVETLNDKMDNKRVNYNLAAFVTAKMVSVDCIRVGDCQSNKCIFTSGENVILSFLRQYSLFLDNFFFSDERLFSELHFDPKITF